MLKTLLIFEIFFDYVEEQLNKKVKVNFKIYDVKESVQQTYYQFLKK